MKQGNDPEYISQDDESEVKRLQDIGGVGEAQFLDEDDIRQYSLGDFSIQENFR